MCFQDVFMSSRSSSAARVYSRKNRVGVVGVPAMGDKNTPSRELTDLSKLL